LGSALNIVASTSAAQPQILAYLDPRDFLRDVYEAEKATSRKASYERFSERLGFGANAYSHLLISGRRPISDKAVDKIAEALAFGQIERRYFGALCRYHYAKDVADREAGLAEVLAIRAKVATSDMDQAQIEYFSEWYHAVIRELVALPDFAADPKWIAARVTPAITPDEAAYSFGLLQRIGYVIFDAGSQRWRQAQVKVSSGSDVRSLALQHFHRQMADRAKDAVLTVAASERELGALTVAMSPEGFQRIKQRLRHIRRTLVDELTAMGPETNQAGDRVYQINLQLFPLTRKS
jgi:uncharacterized protein (TIGR02147 family)